MTVRAFEHPSLSDVVFIAVVIAVVVGVVIDLTFHHPWKLLFFGRASPQRIWWWQVTFGCSFLLLIGCWCYSFNSYPPENQYEEPRISSELAELCFGITSVPRLTQRDKIVFYEYRHNTALVPGPHYASGIRTQSEIPKNQGEAQASRPERKPNGCSETYDVAPGILL